MLQNGESRDYKRNFSPRQLFHKMIPVRMLAVQHGKIFPASPRSMNAFEFARHPSRFVFWSCQLHDADLVTWRFVWREDFLWKVGAYGILPDHLHRHAQDVWRRAIVLRQCHSERGGVLAFFPPGKTLQE